MLAAGGSVTGMDLSHPRTAPADVHPLGGGIEMVARDRQFANTLARGLAVLRCFKVGEPLLGNKEIAQRTGLPKATVSRLAHTLIELGYLRRNAEFGKYELASAVLSLGYPLLGNMRIRQVARPFMKELADHVNGSVSAGLRDHVNMVYVETCRANEALPRRPDIGSSLPIVQSAMGRAWLAAATEAEREHALREIRHQTPEAWRSHRAAVEQGYRDQRARGFCISHGDWEEGTWAVAVPMRRRAGEETLVFNCSTPALGARKRQLETEIGPRLVAMVRSIEHAAGLR
jgi:DNA-binding IclR family transcriptional regulator